MYYDYLFVLINVINVYLFKVSTKIRYLSIFALRC